MDGLGRGRARHLPDDAQHPEPRHVAVERVDLHVEGVRAQVRGDGAPPARRVQDAVQQEKVPVEDLPRRRQVGDADPRRRVAPHDPKGGEVEVVEVREQRAHLGDEADRVGDDAVVLEQQQRHVRVLREREAVRVRETERAVGRGLVVPLAPVRQRVRRREGDGTRLEQRVGGNAADVDAALHADVGSGEQSPERAQQCVWGRETYDAHLHFF